MCVASVYGVEAEVGDGGSDPEAVAATIHPDELSGERATRLVQRLGSERLVLDSDLGDRPGDIVGLARTASLMARAGLSERVIARVAFKNAAEFLRVGGDDS